MITTYIKENRERYMTKTGNSYPEICYLGNREYKQLKDWFFDNQGYFVLGSPFGDLELDGMRIIHVAKPSYINFGMSF